MERPTVELILPDANVTVVLYQYISSGQFKDLQKSLLKGTSLDLSGVSELGEDDQKNMLTDALKNIDAGVAFDQSTLLQKFLVREIRSNTDSTIIPKEAIDTFIYDLSMSDGKLLDEKLAAIEKDSSLSKEAKKK